MPNVCTAPQGAITSAVPGASSSRPSSPRRRASESPAISTVSASAAPVRVMTRRRSTTGVAAGEASAARKCRPDTARECSLFAAARHAAAR